jgi:hypothetical protein
MTTLVEFDFEKDVEKLLPKITDDTINAEIGSFRVGDQKHRIIVCRHWLLGLCHNGIYCSYLHRLDKNRMPPCKHGKLCKIKNCPLKHVADEELEECLFYKQGFCYNGPKCGRRHVKRLPEECPQEAAFEPLGSSQANPNKKLKTGQQNDNYKVTLCTHWLLNSTCPFKDECIFAHGEEELNEGYQPNAEFLVDTEVHDPTRGQIGVPLELPFPTNSRCSYFILQSPDLRSLIISKRKGIWAVPTRIAPEMNASYRSSDHVIIYFSVRPLRGIYGVARMAGQIPQAAAGSPLSPEFNIQWLRTLRLSLKTVAQLKLGMSGMFVGRSSTDGRFDNRVGLDMLLTTYRKPIWDWTKETESAERGIRLMDPTGQFAGEFFPSGGRAAYYLPPDQLFSPDWLERAGLPVNEKGILMTSKGQPFSSPAGGIGGVSVTDQATIMQAANDFYTSQFPGFIVCATPPLIEEMFTRSLIGLPTVFKDINIQQNVPIFIFDQHASMMLGIFFATSPLGSIDASAFTRWAGYNPTGGTNLPVQFTFRVALECPPVHIQDPELTAALGEYAQNLGPIGAKETKALATVFAKRAYSLNSNLIPGRTNRVGAFQNQGPRGMGSTAPFLGKEGGGTGYNYYKPPFKFTEAVAIDIRGSPNEIKKRVLGNNASTIIQLIDEIGSKNSIRIRIRGIGSGFIEANQQELQEPLHFNVSAENDQLLQATVARVRALIQKAKFEIEGGQM